MELRLIIMALVCLCIAQLAFAAEDDQRFINLTKQLRCAECQNQSLFDSNASLAIDMRTQISKMINAGDSDLQIRDFLTYRYGEYILFKPVFSFGTALLWFGPLLMLLAAVFAFFRLIYASS